MKNIKKILLVLILTFVFGTFAQTTYAFWGDVGEFLGDMFSTGEDSISFKDYEGQFATLSDEGLDPQLTKSKDLRGFIVMIVNFALGFLGLLSVLIVIYGGVLYVSSGGQEEKTQTGKKAITYASIGILIILGSYAFVNTIIKGATGNEENMGTIQAAYTGGGFNSSAEELRSLAMEIYNGFKYLAETTEDLKNIKNDAEKSSLLPGNYPPKSDVLNFLESVKTKLKNIEDKSQDFSVTQSNVKELIRILDKEIDGINTLSDELVLMKAHSGDSTEDDICPGKDDLLDEEGAFGLGWEAGYENLSEEEVCIKSDYKIKYTPGLYKEWTKLQEKYTEKDSPKFYKISEDDPETKALIDGLTDATDDQKGIYGAILYPVSTDYTKDLKRIFGRIEEIYNDLQNISAISGGKGGEAHKEMLKAGAYGYNVDPLTTITAADGDQDCGSLGALKSVTNIGDVSVVESGLLDSISKWNVDTSIDKGGEYMVKGLEEHSKLYQELKNLKYVQAHLTANVLEGTAPLTVLFDTIGTVDPAAGSVKGSNITWDLAGVLTSEILTSGDVPSNSCFTAKDDQGGKVYLPSDSSVECYPIENSGADQEAIEEGDFIGVSSRRCNFTTPGTYTAAVKIKSNDSTQYAPGLSLLLIKVNPPTTKIELTATPDGVTTPIVLMHYYNETLVVDKKNLSVTTNQAKTGIVINAGATKADKYEINVGEKCSSTADDNITGNFTITCPETPDEHEITLYVTNKLGVTDKKIFTLEVSSLVAYLTSVPEGEAMVNEIVKFDASGSKSDFGKIKNYKWTVHNNDTNKDLTLPQPEGKDLSVIEYQFEESGKYTVTVTVTDEANSTASDNVDIQIKSKPPVAIIDYEIPKKNQPGKVYLSADRSFDPDSPEKTLTYIWTISPDSNNGENWKWEKTGGEKLKNPIVIFNKKGEYDVKLTVASSPEEDNSVTKKINVTNVLDIEFGEMTDTAQLNDKGEAKIDFTLKSQNAAEYEIIFGDEDKSSGKFTNKEAKISHTYKQSGAFQVEVKVYDADYNDNSIKKQVFIGDGVNPIAKISISVNGEEVVDLADLSSTGVTRKDIITFDGSESKNIDGTGKDLSYSWNFGDDKSSSKSATHKYDELGEYNIELTVTDKEDPTKLNKATAQIKVIAKDPKFSGIQIAPDTRNNLVTPVNVTVKAFGAEDEDGEITQYKWWYYDMDDPDEPLGIQITQTPSVKLIVGTNGAEGYTRNYGFGLEVTDTDGKKATNKRLTDDDTIKLLEIITPTLEVKNGPNDMPVAKFNVDKTSVLVNEEITFTSASTDSDGTIDEYIWDFEGDGFGNNDSTTETVVTHAYKEKNLKGYNVRLKVVDNDKGESISEPITIYVDSISKPPVAAFKYEVVDGSSGKKIKFINNSTSDEETDAEIISYVWDFDTQSAGESADSDGDGTKDNDTDSKEENPQRLYTEFGTYTVKLTVTDNQGNEDDVTHTITIPMANAPVAAFTYELSDDKIIFKNNSTSDTAKGAQIEKYIWDFDTASALTTADSDGDGKKDNDTDSTQKNPQYTYEHKGVYSVKLTVIDNQGGTDEVVNQVDTGKSGVDLGGDTDIGTDNGDTGDENSDGGDTNTVNLTAVLITDPLPSNDGIIYLQGDSGSVKFDFSKSVGPIAYYIIDKNIYFDKDANGVKEDDEDFKTPLPGTWQTNFDKSWGKIVVKLTVTDIYGNEHFITQEIKFQ